MFGVASSGYSKSLEPASPSPPSSILSSTWRAGLSSDKIFTDLIYQHGPIEIKRQEIMWEVCETEKAFVQSMKTVLRLFATPLKTPQGKWIDGIPPRVSELFDLLECLVQVHSSVVSAQRDLRRRNGVLQLEAFVTMFKTWVERLEVHEWYLMRFEGVVQLVEDNVRDSESVFGEFVRMQMKEEVLGAMSLGSMLLKPVQRLTKYPLFLKVGLYWATLTNDLSSACSTSHLLRTPVTPTSWHFSIRPSPSSSVFKPTKPKPTICKSLQPWKRA